MAPDPGQAIGLQLQADGERVSLGRVAALQRADLLLDPQQFLHVVPNLVRDDVRLRELARRAELRAQLVEEAEVDIDLFVLRAVERSGGRLRGPATRLRIVTE